MCIPSCAPFEAGCKETNMHVTQLLFSQQWQNPAELSPPHPRSISFVRFHGQRRFFHIPSLLLKAPRQTDSLLNASQSWYQQSTILNIYYRAQQMTKGGSNWKTSLCCTSIYHEAGEKMQPSKCAHLSDPAVSDLAPSWVGMGDRK